MGERTRHDDIVEILDLRDRVAELERERVIAAEIADGAIAMAMREGADVMRERLQREVHRRLVTAWDERCREGMPYELRHAVEALDEACALPLDDARPAPLPPKRLGEHVRDRAAELVHRLVRAHDAGLADEVAAEVRRMAVPDAIYDAQETKR